MRTRLPQPLPIDTTLLTPGLRLAVGVSGGADSVALTRVLAQRAGALGLVLHVAHLHHGLRDAEADVDLEFVRAFAARLSIPFREARVDTRNEARKNGESIEEAARRLRYNWFRQLMASGEVDAVATAHTLDDQAETVLAKFLRGAWTEGLGGIHPVVEFPEGRILRPLLAATRVEVEVFLRSLGEVWREDSSNSDPAYTRNRIRHELLPLLEAWNPRLRAHLAHMAELARDDEAAWQAEMERLAPQLLLPGRPVRGGGRATGDGLAIDVTRLAALNPAVQRRILRFAVEQLGAALDFQSTEALLNLGLTGKAGQKRELSQGVKAERTPRELRLTMGEPAGIKGGAGAPRAEYSEAIPGEIAAPAFGLRLSIRVSDTGGRAELPADQIQVARLRNWRPGDKVRLRHSSGPRKVKEVLERLRVTGSSRAVWPVLEVSGQIVWMQGVELEPEQGIEVVATSLDEAHGAAGV